MAVLSRDWRLTGQTLAAAFALFPRRERGEHRIGDLVADLAGLGLIDGIRATPHDVAGRDGKERHSVWTGRVERSPVSAEDHADSERPDSERSLPERS